MQVAPSRARGLKLRKRGRMLQKRPVAPSRARGLKRHTKTCGNEKQAGRALTGAWIETIFIMLLMDLVVSHEINHQCENLFF